LERKEKIVLKTILERPKTRINRFFGSTLGKSFESGRKEA
jgi:hypothetical protein